MISVLASTAAFTPSEVLQAVCLIRGVTRRDVLTVCSFAILDRFWMIRSCAAPFLCYSGIKGYK